MFSYSGTIRDATTNHSDTYVLKGSFVRPTDSQFVVEGPLQELGSGLWWV